MRRTRLDLDPAASARSSSFLIPIGRAVQLFILLVASKKKKNDQINFSLTVRQEHMGRCDAVRWPVGPRDGLAWPGRQNKLGPPHCFLFIYLLFRFLCLLAVIFLPYLREHFVLTLEERLDRWMRNYIMKLDR